MLKILKPMVFSDLTETGVIAYQQKSGKIGSSGHVGRNIRLMVTSLYPSVEKIPLGPNVRGLIWCRSPYMMKKYYSDTTSDVNYCGNFSLSSF